VPTAYLVVAGADSTAGIGAVQFGISFNWEVSAYNPVYWTNCGDLEFPHGSPSGDPWLSSGSGNQILWNTDTNCQRTTIGDEGVHAIVGAFNFRLYAGGEQFAITADSSLAVPAILIEDCSGGESQPAVPGGIVRYGAPGFNPCTDSVPTSSTTWGRIKGTYRQ
jgi:hypothetical protein